MADPASVLAEVERFKADYLADLHEAQLAWRQDFLGNMVEAERRQRNDARIVQANERYERRVKRLKNAKT